MIPEIHKILYCTDLSDSSANAFRYAVGLSKVSGAEIHILHVVGELSQDAKVTLKSYMVDAGGPDLDTVLRSRKSESKKELLRRIDVFWADADESELELKKKIASVDIREAHPAQAILRKTSELGADIVIMGTHEKGFAAQAFLGSVAKSVMRNSKVPVVVVPLPPL